MKVISFYSEKGGTGKTTLNILLASYIHSIARKKVMVLDLDYPGYHFSNLRNRELSAYEEDEKKLDKYIQESRNIYKILKMDHNDMEKNISYLQDIKVSSDIDYIVVDLPGSLTNDLANKLITTKFIDKFYLPTELDPTVVVSNIKLAKLLQKFAEEVQIVYNKTYPYEKEELYQANMKLLKEIYQIDVNEIRIKNSIYLRREFGNDEIFFKSTLCYPEKLINKKLTDLTTLLNNISHAHTDSHLHRKTFAT